MYTAFNMHKFKFLDRLFPNSDARDWGQFLEKQVLSLEINLIP